MLEHLLEVMVRPTALEVPVNDVLDFKPVRFRTWLRHKAYPWPYAELKVAQAVVLPKKIC